MGQTAREHVRGTLRPDGLLRLEGYRSENPRLIGTDSYRLRLRRPLGLVLEGSSRCAGAWDGLLKLRRTRVLLLPSVGGFYTALEPPAEEVIAPAILIADNGARGGRPAGQGPAEATARASRPPQLVPPVSARSGGGGARSQRRAAVTAVTAVTAVGGPGQRGGGGRGVGATAAEAVAKCPTTPTRVSIPVPPRDH